MRGAAASWFDRDAVAALDALFSALPVGLMIFDTDLRYLRVNDALLAMNGGTFEERHGRTVREVHPDLADDVEDALRQVLDTGRPILGRRQEGELRYSPGQARVWRKSYIPIEGPDGKRCAVGVITEDVTDAEIAEAAARRDRARLELLARATAEANEAMEQSREIATTLQRSMLPSAEVDSVDGLEVSARYLPAADDAEVGGDWYDVVRPGRGGIGLVIGDVMGRGVEAAAVMGQVRTAVRAYAKLDLSPAEMLGALDRLMADGGESEIVTCIYAVLDTSTYELRFANAGHVPPLVALAGGEKHSLDAEQGPPLGAGVGGYCEHVWSLPEEAVLALYTDGLVESPGHDLEDGINTLATVLDCDSKTLDGLCDAALATMAPVSGQEDDQALLLVRRPAQPVA